MAFIHTLIYDGNYPLTGNNKPEVCAYLKDLTILLFSDKEPLSETYSIQCTDFILSPSHCLFSCVASDGTIFSANISSPVPNKVYPLYSNKVYCGCLTFSRIPSTTLSAVNLSNVYVNKTCIITRAHNEPVSVLGLGNNPNIVVTGSLKVSIDALEDATYVYIYPDEEIFVSMVNGDVKNISEEWGFTSINGVTPNGAGNISINIEGYDISKPVGNYLIIKPLQDIYTLCDNNKDILERIKCSVSEGDTISYPLDGLVCSESTVTCPPEWDVQK